MNPSDDIAEPISLHYVKDFSELKQDQQDEELRLCLKRNGASILIANTGPLLNAFKRLLGDSCEGSLLDAMDDAQYSYLAFNQNDILYLPAESVYAVFEVKQTLNKRFMEYAGKKASSVRKLHRTSTSIPYAGGMYKPKQPNRIISGILTTDCEWKEGFGQPFQKCLKQYLAEEQIDCGCVLKGGAFFFDYSEQILKTSKAEEGLVFFFLQLLIKLQQMGTVSAIDLNEYMSALSITEANWLISASRSFVVKFFVVGF